MRGTWRFRLFRLVVAGRCRSGSLPARSGDRRHFLWYQFHFLLFSDFSSIGTCSQICSVFFVSFRFVVDSATPLIVPVFSGLRRVEEPTVEEEQQAGVDFIEEGVEEEAQAQTFAEDDIMDVDQDGDS